MKVEIFPLFSGFVVESWHEYLKDNPLPNAKTEIMPSKITIEISGNFSGAMQSAIKTKFDKLCHVRFT